MLKKGGKTIETWRNHTLTMTYPALLFKLSSFYFIDKNPEK
jgi:hypothetical protein